MSTVRSADGTSIEYRALGGGPPIVLIGGAFCDGGSFDALAGRLAGEFTTITYDRRGRGRSGDTEPYSVQREIEDLATILEVYGPAAVYGHSSGAILALECALAGLPIHRLSVYEPPYVGAPGPPFGPEVTALIDGGQMEAAATAWLAGAGVPPAVLNGILQSPGWAGMVEVAPTLLYDLALAGDGEVPDERLSQLSTPVLVAYGALSSEPLRRGAGRLAEALPAATVAVCEGQDHTVADTVIAPLITAFCR